MTEAEFIEFARSAALRATSNIGQIGHLVCTQANAKGEPTVREPEMRAAFQQEAEETWKMAERLALHLISGVDAAAAGGVMRDDVCLLVAVVE